MTKSCLRQEPAGSFDFAGTLRVPGVSAKAYSPPLGGARFDGRKKGSYVFTGTPGVTGIYAKAGCFYCLQIIHNFPGSFSHYPYRTKENEIEGRYGRLDGQDKRFEQIYENTKVAALRFITSKCLNICDIEDIYQETYLAVCRSLKNRTERIDSEEAYVIAIAKRCVSRHYSAVQKLKALIGTGLSKLPEKALTEEVRAEEDTEQLAVDRQLLEEIFDTVASMPADVQRIFYMYYVLDMKLGEISERLNIPTASVKQKLYRTLSMIRRLYKRRDTL